MREIIKFPREKLKPAMEAVLKSQGIPRNVKPQGRIAKMAGDAVEMFMKLCEPIGVISEITIPEFGEVYAGEGQNEVETPVADIFRNSENLALFAITVGDRVSHRISGLFDCGDFASGSMLDGAASEATEKAGIFAEKSYFEKLVSGGMRSADNAVVRYSPGYCGWHISGQKKLFEFLRPEEIGIELTENFLMHPLKSISGVMIVGPKEIHDFDMTYSFCDECADQGCRERIRAIMGN